MFLPIRSDPEFSGFRPTRPAWPRKPRKEKFFRRRIVANSFFLADRLTANDKFSAVEIFAAENFPLLWLILLRVRGTAGAVGHRRPERAGVRPHGLKLESDGPKLVRDSRRRHGSLWSLGSVSIWPGDRDPGKCRADVRPSPVRFWKRRVSRADSV